MARSRQYIAVHMSQKDKDKLLSLAARLNVPTYEFARASFILGACMLGKVNSADIAKLGFYEAVFKRGIRLAAAGMLAVGTVGILNKLMPQIAGDLDMAEALQEWDDLSMESEAE